MTPSPKAHDKPVLVACFDDWTYFYSDHSKMGLRGLITYLEGYFRSEKGAWYKKGIRLLKMLLTLRLKPSQVQFSENP